MENTNKILIISTPRAQSSYLATIAHLLSKNADVTVVTDQPNKVSGRAFNNIICDELAEPIDMSVPEPKNKPHGPQRNSKKGKARKW